MTTALLFVMGVLSAGRISVAFLYIQEMVPEKSRSIVGTVALGYDCMTMCWATLYFMFISHYTIYWEYFAVIQNIVSVLLLIRLVPESPKWLYEKGRYVEVKDALIAVARANGVSVVPL